MLTLTEAAAQLGVHPATLRQQIANGALKARKIGPIWTITAAELKRYRALHLGRPGRKPRSQRP